ncbi:MAG: hypothetical protein Q8R36_04975 [bacterium]|nr:hypothetical protein [bacterium]
MTLQDFKLAVLALNDFSDAEVENLFLDLEIKSKDDIGEAVGIMGVHRPELLEKLNQKYCPKRAA